MGCSISLQYMLSTITRSVWLFTNLASVTTHRKEMTHSELFMLYGIMILRIGGFLLELTMHRSYVNLNWDISYSQISRYANFDPPKVQITLKKVSDFHKSADLSMSSRTANIREILMPYVQQCKKMNTEPLVTGFEDWLEKRRSKIKT